MVNNLIQKIWTEPGHSANVYTNHAHEQLFLSPKSFISSNKV